VDQVLFMTTNKLGNKISDAVFGLTRRHTFSFTFCFRVLFDVLNNNNNNIEILYYNKITTDDLWIRKSKKRLFCSM